jgi:hypothetical protein
MLFNDLLFNNASFDDLEGLQEWNFAEDSTSKSAKNPFTLTEDASSFQAINFQDWTFLDSMNTASSYNPAPNTPSINNEMSSYARGSEIWSMLGTSSETFSRSRNQSIAIQEDFFHDMDSQDYDFLTSNPALFIEDSDPYIPTMSDEIPLSSKESQVLHFTEDKSMEFTTNQNPFPNHPAPDLPEWTYPTKAPQDPHNRAPSSSQHSPPYIEPGEMQDMATQSPRYFSTDLSWDYTRNYV